MISHDNIMTVMKDQDEAFAINEDDVGLSFLPMAHVAERILAFYGRINTGMGTYFASSIAKVLEEVVEVKPTIFGSVPRIFEKAYAKIMSTVEQAPPTRQRIFRWAERVGREAVQRWQAGKPIPFGLKLKYGLADRLVFSKLRAVFGGRVRYFITGAAPIAPEILEFFWAAGFPIYEMYGMTESTVITHANVPGKVKLGSVGRALSIVEDRIADDGEILVRGKCVFQGYYKNPQATAETVIDGWLYTGDVGKKDEDGCVYILDRKKHIIITAGGKNLTPANIENEIKASDPMISQAHAHGDKRKYLVALVTIGAGEAVDWARQQGSIDGATADKHIKALSREPARPLQRAPGAAGSGRAGCGRSQTHRRFGEEGQRNPVAGRDNQKSLRPRPRVQRRGRRAHPDAQAQAQERRGEIPRNLRSALRRRGVWLGRRVGLGLGFDASYS